MSKFIVSATVDDSRLKGDAIFEYRIVDNHNYIIDENGGVEAKPGYTPQIGDKFTVEVLYRCDKEFISKMRKTFTVKI